MVQKYDHIRFDDESIGGISNYRLFPTPSHCWKPGATLVEGRKSRVGSKLRKEIHI